MSACELCAHVKIDAINAALDHGRPPRLVRHQFALDWQSLEAHIAHRSAAAAALPGVTTRQPSSPQALPAPEYPGKITKTWRAFQPQVIGLGGEEHGPPIDTPEDALRQGLPYVRQAIRLAGMDEDRQRHLIEVLNEAITSERMGL